MPKVSEMIPSRFLKKDDVPAPVLVTVMSLSQEEMDKDSGELKWAVHFQEFDKPMALNSTNIQLCAAIFSSDDTDDWVGKKLVLYTDPTIMFAGKVTGGLRVRAPKQAPKPAAKPAARPAPAPAEGVAEMDDDIPY
jgi:hypothetical protein